MIPPSPRRVESHLFIDEDEGTTKISPITDSCHSHGTNSGTNLSSEEIPSSPAPDLRLQSALKRLVLRSKTQLWAQSCYEVEEDVKELNSILSHLGLPDYNYCKDKSFPYNQYLTTAPDMKTCSSKDYLDMYIFPYVLPAIGALIKFMREKRIFQCRFSTFNPLDYISEYLYNHNNSLHPERAEKGSYLFKTDFAKEWLEKYPRPAVPKWLHLSKQEAALRIQRLFRGYLVRRRPDVQELRQFWEQLKKDQEETQELLSPRTNAEPTLGQEEKEEHASMDSSESELETHSVDCINCKDFKATLTEQEKQLKLKEKEEEKGQGKFQTTAEKDLRSDDKNLYAKKHDNCCYDPKEHLALPHDAAFLAKNQGKNSQPFPCTSKPKILGKKSAVRAVVISQTEIRRTSFSLDSFMNKKFKSLNVDVPIVSRTFSGMGVIRRSTDSRN